MTMYSFSTRLHEDTDINDGPVIFGTADLNVGDGYDEFTGLITMIKNETIGFLPPANEVCEGYVFTPVCQSFRPQGAGVSRPTPRGEVEGSGWGGLQAHT